jgi:hypothetical protein
MSAGYVFSDFILLGDFLGLSGFFEGIVTFNGIVRADGRAFREYITRRASVNGQGRCGEGTV